MEFLERYVIKDWKMKVLAIVIAATLWLVVTHLGESQMSVSVMVNTKGVGRDLMVKKIWPDYVLLDVSGPVSVLKDLKAHDMRVTLDLAGANKGDHVFNLQRGNVEITKGIKVDRIRPEHVAVKIDRMVDKRLKVNVRLDPKWQEMYKVKSYYPSYVNVEGSEDSLAEKTIIETLDIDGDFNGEEEWVDVALNTKDIEFKSLRPSKIRVLLRRQ